MISPISFAARAERLREFAHFLGHDGESPAGLAGAGGFDARIQGQQVGLEGDFVDHGDDRRDLLRTCLDPMHRLDRIVHHLVRFDRCLAGLSRFRARLPDLVRGRPDGGRDLLERRGRLFEGCRLLLGALREALRRCVHLGAARMKRPGLLHHLLQHGLEQPDRIVEIAPQRLELFGEGQIDRHADVALGEPRKAGAEILDDARERRCLGLALGEPRSPLLLRPLLRQTVVFRQLDVVEPGLAEDGEAAGHVADLVLPPGIGRLRREVAFRKPKHVARHPVQGDEGTSPDEPGAGDAAEQRKDTRRDGNTTERSRRRGGLSLLVGQEGRRHRDQLDDGIAVSVELVAERVHDGCDVSAVPYGRAERTLDRRPQGVRPGQDVALELPAQVVAQGELPPVVAPYLVLLPQFGEPCEIFPGEFGMDHGFVGQEIGFDEEHRRRQDVGYQVLPSDDLPIKRTVHLQGLQGVVLDAERDADSDTNENSDCNDDLPDTERHDQPFAEGIRNHMNGI
jgi:hypothetical protein